MKYVIRVENKRGYMFTCIKCHRKTANIYADMWGKPFKAYYCVPCLKKMTYNEEYKVCKKGLT